MTREEALNSVVRYERPLEMLRNALAPWPWDWDSAPIAHVSNDAVRNVIRRYLAGDLSAADVEEWANLLEVREDVDFEPAAASAIFDLANPELEGALPVLAAKILDSL